MKNETAPAPPPSPVCGNGILEKGEECDGNAQQCAAGQACGTDCKCAAEPVVAIKNFTMDELAGQKETYNAGESIQVRFAGTEEDGSPAKAANGYMVQAYIYDDPPTRAVASLEGSYADGYWTVSTAAPVAKGNYKLKVILVCAKYGSACDKKYGAGKLLVQYAPFNVVLSCHDSGASYNIYQKGNVTGISPYNGTMVTLTDYCLGDKTLMKYSCEGIRAQGREKTCEYGCYDGACKLGNATLSISPSDLAGATTGIYYSATLEAHGGVPPYGDFAVIDGRLPDGLTLNPQSGAITGIPQNLNSPVFTVWIQDSNGNMAHRTYTIQVWSQ